MLAFWQQALGLQDVGVEWSYTSTPGGKARVSGHSYIKECTELQDIEVELAPDLEGEELELTIVHELLHVAFRHAIAFSAALIPNDTLHALLFEEDTERLAKALVRMRWKPPQPNP
jgi:hypothetical protein